MLYLLLKSLEFAGAFTPTGITSRMAINMIITVNRLLIFIAVLLILFGHTFLILIGDQQDGYESVQQSILKLYRNFVGDSDWDTISQVIEGLIAE